MKYRIPFGNRELEISIEIENIRVEKINPKKVKPVDDYLKLF